MRSIPSPGFPGDDGSAPQEVREALASYAVDTSRHAATLLVLQRARLLVPVVALPGEADGAGGAEMATVQMRGRDGRSALLAFTSTTSLTLWNQEARPVPVTAARAAQAAAQEGAVALLVDVAGPVKFVIETPALLELARGSVLVRLSDGHGWARPIR
ncbi:hypothetical protein BH18ACT9_BH18ACT9_10750 [soil metagenome]